MARAPQKTNRGGGGEEPKTRAVAKQTGGSRAVTNYEEELARQAQEATDMEKGAPMGRSFSFKGGQMVFDGAPIKENKVVVIIAGAVIEKAYYEGRYDPNNPEPPTCYAFGTDPDDLAPNEKDVANLQCASCADCELNVFGSADTGRGKACKDVRRLALIPAGTIAKNGDIQLIEDADELAKAEFGFAKLPPTSLTPYATFVRQVASTMKRPPHGVYALMECIPDETNQFKVIFEALDLVDGKLLGAVMTRHEEAMTALVQPYTYMSDDEKKSRNRNQGSRKPAGNARKPAAGGQRSRKY